MGYPKEMPEQQNDVILAINQNTGRICLSELIVSITTIIILVAVVLVLSVVVSIVITKREQAATLRRQQVASFRRKADEAQDLYDGLQIAGLEKSTYKFLLERITFNLKNAYDIDPKAVGIRTRLNSATKLLESIDEQSFLVQMPGNIMELHGLIGRLNKLIKYFMLLLQNKSISPTLYQKLMPSIQQSSIKFDVEGHIKMGHQAANSGQAGTAKQSYTHARDQLINLGTEDAYAQKQLQVVEDLLASLKAEPGDATQSENQTEQETTETSANKSENMTAEEKEAADIKEAIASQTAMNKKSEEEDGYTEKKKW